MTYRLERQTTLAMPLDRVFAFFEDPRNLAALTPPWLDFKMVNSGDFKMRKGAEIDYKIRWMGLSIGWKTRIVEYDPPRLFVDEQERGPYALWHHEHTFTQNSEGVTVRDRVDYRLPFGIFGRIAHALAVRRQLEEIFDYRETALRRLLTAQT